MADGTQISVLNPRTGEVDYRFTQTSPNRVAVTCANLRQYQKAWEDSGLENRTKVLRAFVQALNENSNFVVDALINDTGRRGLSIMEVGTIGSAVERWIKIAEAAEAPQHGRSSALPFITYSIEKRPYSLVGVISPWNFPLTLSLIDAIPALLAGAAVLIKPSEVTPRFAGPLRDILKQVPELEAVLSIVDGAGETGAAIVDHVDVICFTGSVATGRKVGEQAARNFIVSFLELGGKDPAIVLASADIDRATTALLRGSIVNTGQACQSIERIYVDKEIYAPFVELLVEKATAVRLNTPDIHSGHLGPLIFKKQADIIEAQISDAVIKGAKIHTGGKIVKDGGLWCPPTILTDLTDDMTIMTDETFGPLLPIIPFATVGEAIKRANKSEFGLSASVFAGTPEEAIIVGRQIEAGGISINDAALTSLMYEAEKNSFKLSGMGASRMGPTGYARFFRKQSFMVNTSDVFTIDQLGEAATPKNKE